MANIRKILTRLTIYLLTINTFAGAQDVASPLKLEEAIELASQNYPAIHVAQAQYSAAGANVELARNAYLPRAEMSWQQTRGTRNNVFGQFFPQPGVPPISGPLLPNSSFTESVWGSGGGLLVSWEIFDFGVRKAELEVARRIAGESEARIAAVGLDVAVVAADAFLRVVAADQAVRAAQANVDRMRTFATSVHVLVENQLRPGADASRSDAELAAAQSVLIQAKQNAAITRVNLAESIGQAGRAVIVDGFPLLELPAPPSAEASDLSSHPMAQAQEASIETAIARQRALDRSLMPRVKWQAAIFGRGSGASPDGRLFSTRGLFPDTPNWGTGLTISFAPTDIFNIRTRRRQEDSFITAERARYEQTLQKLRSEEASARIAVESARELATNTPLQLQAAQETELRVRKRYEAELGTLTEVAEAQRLLAQAEVENALARLSVWHALLAEARAKGALKPFLELLQNTRNKK